MKTLSKVLTAVLTLAIAGSMVALGACGGGDDVDPDDGDNTNIDNIEPTPATGTDAEYTTPTTAYTVWQAYTNDQFAAEDTSSKSIAYQFVEQDMVLDTMTVDLLINMYTDGFADVTQYNVAGGYETTYYGYWANMDDYLYLGIICHTNSTAAGTVYGISYSYQLTITDGKFDAFTFNAALGFAEGGQFVRQGAISSTNAAVRYSTKSAFETAIGYTSSYSGGTTDDTTKSILFSFTGFYCTFDCYNDGTYTFSYPGVLSESGTWTWDSWKFTYTTPDGNTNTASQASEAMDLERAGVTVSIGENALYFTYTADINDQLSDVFYAETSAWGVAFGGQGSYTPSVSGSTDDSTEEATTVLTISTNYAGDTTVDMLFTSDGKYSVYSGMGSGTWTVDEDGVLSLAADSGSTITIKCADATEKTVTLTAYSGQVSLTFTFSDDNLTALGASSLAEIKEAALVLTNETGGYTSTLTLYADGTYAFASIKSDEGSWSISDNIITLTPNEGTELTLGTDESTIVAVENTEDDATGYTITVRYYSGAASVAFTYTADQVAGLASDADAE